MEIAKPIEYELWVPEHRIVAFVDNKRWEDFLFDRCSDFDFVLDLSTTAVASRLVLVKAPIHRSDIVRI